MRSGSGSSGKLLSPLWLVTLLKSWNLVGMTVLHTSPAPCDFLQSGLQSELTVLSLLCPPVIDGLDLLKKEQPGARDGIRYLEAEFKKGNR